MPTSWSHLKPSLFYEFQTMAESYSKLFVIVSYYKRLLEFKLRGKGIWRNKVNYTIDDGEIVLI